MTDPDRLADAPEGPQAEAKQLKEAKAKAEAKAKKTRKS